MISKLHEPTLEEYKERTGIIANPFFWTDKNWLITAVNEQWEKVFWSNEIWRSIQEVLDKRLNITWVNFIESINASWWKLTHSNSDIVWIFVDTNTQIAFQLMWTISDFWYQWQVIELRWSEWLKIWLNALNLRSDQLINFLASLSVEETWKKYTGPHLIRVKEWTRIFWAELVRRGLVDEAFINEVIIASPLHDIWKIDVPGSILYSWDELTEIESYAMKQWHVINWYNLLYSLKNLSAVALNIVLWHHEQWDGTWYPLSKKGDDIHLEAQIISLVDYYDALTSVRPYRSKKHDPDVVMWFMQNDRWRRFKPLLVDAFEQCYRSIPVQSLKEAESMLQQYHGKAV